jgi:fructokinase
MQPPLVIGLGELLWDDFPDGRRPGGAPANVAYHANQLGCRGLPASRIGQDADGVELAAALSRSGLDTKLVQRDPVHSTGRVTVELTAGGQPAYVIHEDVAWDHLAPEASLLQAARDCDALCFGTLAQRAPRSRETIQACLAAARGRALILCDVNLRQHWYDADVVERSARAADVVKLNDEELSVLCRLFALPESEESLATQLRGWGVGLMVLTRGARGCSLRRGSEVAEVPAAPVQVADTVGAGDAFAAALIVGLLRGWPLERCGRFANRIGGLVASRAGAMPEISAAARGLLDEAESGG